MMISWARYPSTALRLQCEVSGQGRKQTGRVAGAVGPQPAPPQRHPPGDSQILGSSGFLCTSLYSLTVLHHNNLQSTRRDLHAQCRPSASSDRVPRASSNSPARRHHRPPPLLSPIHSPRLHACRPRSKPSSSACSAPPSSALRPTSLLPLLLPLPQDPPSRPLPPSRSSRSRAAASARAPRRNSAARSTPRRAKWAGPRTSLCAGAVPVIGHITGESQISKEDA